MGKQAVRPTLEGNYLSRMALKDERRRHERRSCSFPAKLLYTRKGTRGIVCHDVTIVDLSEGGARLIDSRAAEVPTHFYLYFGNFELAVGCAAVKPGDLVLGVRFIKEQPGRLIDYLVRERKAGELDDLSPFQTRVVHH